MLLSEFSHDERISACTRTIIFNKYEQNNMEGEILNGGENVDYQENFAFTGSYFKMLSTNINDYIKNNFLNMQQENLRSQRTIENNDNQTDERYQKKLFYDKESDKRDQKSKNDEEKIIEDIEIMKQNHLSSQRKKIYIFRNNLMK